MKISFIGGVRTVTGSSFLINTDTSNILIDCGMFQGRKNLVERNYLEALYDPEDIDAVLLTHAHIDHSGLIPKLVRGGFRGKIFATKATCDLSKLMLLDAAHIQELEARSASMKNKRQGFSEVLPLYVVDDVTKTLPHFEPIDYETDFPVTENIRATFRDAGHILGSAMIELYITENGKEAKLVFSGDIGVADQPILRDPSVISETDYLFIESTYGNRLHKSKEDSKEEFKDVIKKTLKQKGKVIIPSFAVGRAQEIIYYLAEFYREGIIKDIPIFVDSPMSASATDIMKNNPECFDPETRDLLMKGSPLFEIPTLTFTRSVEESRAINTLEGSAIIISASGMCDAGRIKHHLRHNLWRPETSVIFVGFQAEGTLGRLIVSGAEEVKIFGEEIKVNAKIYTIGGLSAHADREELLTWASHFRAKPPMVFVIHGEERVSEAFASGLKDELNFNAYVPSWGEVVELHDERKFTTLGIKEIGDKVVSRGSRFTKDLAMIKGSIEKLESGDTPINEELLYEKIKRIKRLLSEIETHKQGQ